MLALPAAAQWRPFQNSRHEGNSRNFRKAIRWMHGHVHNRGHGYPDRLYSAEWYTFPVSNADIPPDQGRSRHSGLTIRSFRTTAAHGTTHPPGDHNATPTPCPQAHEFIMPSGRDRLALGRGRGLRPKPNATQVPWCSAVTYHRAGAVRRPRTLGRVLPRKDLTAVRRGPSMGNTASRLCCRRVSPSECHSTTNTPSETPCQGCSDSPAA